MIAAARAAMAAKKAGSLVNQGKAFNKLQKANFGIGVPVAGAGAAGMFDDSEMEIINILQESGKTISDMDRNLIKQMLASGNSPEVVIKTILGQSGKTMSNMDRQMMAGGGTPFPDLTGDGQVTRADILKGRGVYAEGDEVTQNLFSDERIKQLYSGATDADLSMLGQMQENPIPGTPEDYEKKIYLLEKEIASQFKEYHGAVEGGFEEQAAARLQGIQEMMTQRLQLKNEYTNQFNSNKVKGMAEGGEAINNELAGMEMSEEDAMAEIQGIAPQAKMIEQLVMAVMQMVQQGIGEQEIIDFLKEQGLDDEDIEDLFTMVMQQMQQGQQGQEDPIANELQEMS